MAAAKLPRRATAHRRVTLPAHCLAGRVGIVTVTYNGAKVLPGFLASLDALVNRDFQLYVVDNASHDDTLAMVRAWCDDGGHKNSCTIIANADNRGVGAANNQGTEQAIADGCAFVLHINNDVEFGPELLDELIAGLKQHNADMTTPLTYFFDPPDRIWAAGGYFQPMLGYRNLHTGEGQRDRGQFSQSRRITYAPTSCMLFRREVFATVGLMEERYFLYHDDSDLLLRAWKAGLTLYYIPNAKMWHKVSSIAGVRSWASVRFGIRGRALFLAKFCSLPVSLLFSGLYRSYFLLRWILRKDSREFFLLKEKVWGEGFRMGREEPAS